MDKFIKVVVRGWEVAVCECELTNEKDKCYIGSVSKGIVLVS